MTNWLIIGGYLLGWLMTARYVAVGLIGQTATRELERREDWRKRFREPHENDGKSLVDGEDRVLSLAMGLMLGMVWPVVLIVAAVARTLRSPVEKREDQHVELEKLRAQAKAYGLPFGDEKKEGTS